MVVRTALRRSSGNAPTPGELAHAHARRHEQWQDGQGAKSRSEHSRDQDESRRLRQHQESNRRFRTTYSNHSTNPSWQSSISTPPESDVDMEP